jgi:hypothetical protein
MSVLCALFRLLPVLLVLPAQGAMIFPAGSEWKYLKGTAEASAPDPSAWRGNEFDDSHWAAGLAPFYYGKNLQGTLLEDMRGGYTSVFFRLQFKVEDLQEIRELQLRALSDDGFIAWINGVEVARYNMPSGEIEFHRTSLAALPEPVPFETHVLNRPWDYIVEGTNVLAVHAFNASLSASSDFVFEASLSSVGGVQPPMVLVTDPLPYSVVRELAEIEIHFSESMQGVTAEDLLVNGLPVEEVEEISPDVYLFRFPEPDPGHVQVQWRTGHLIRALHNQENRFAGGIWSYTLAPEVPAPDVMISEFMASNGRTISDEDGDRSDWIEIYNPHPTPANLKGWFLTDRADNLTMWRFPEVVLEGNGYLLVFASGKDRTDPGGRLHTNFRLSSSGEYLGLVNSMTNVVSEFAPIYPEQFEDISYGRERMNPEVVGYYPTPTPGKPNSTSGPGFSSEVHFSMAGGTFLHPFIVELSTGSAGAVIRYTTDGTPPGPQSAVYTAPIVISTTQVIRARAFELGLWAGPVRSESYIGLSSSLVDFTSNLPILIIDNFGAGSVPVRQRQLASITILDTQGGRSSLANAPVLSTRAGIRVRGSSTVNFPKSSFSVEFWDEMDDDRDFPVLGMPSESNWVLYAPNRFEPVMIHNPFIYQLSNDIGRYASRTRFVEVYLNREGGMLSPSHYNGVYVLIERIKRSTHRVNVNRLDAEHKTPPEVTGGYILKIDRLGPGEKGFSAAGQKLVYVYPKELTITLPERSAQAEYIQSYLDAFEEALYGDDFTDPDRGYARYVDVDSLIDHHLLNVLAFNVDGLRYSTFFHKPRGGKLAFGPIWDFDRSLGSRDGRDGNPRVWAQHSPDCATCALSTDFFNYIWWDRMFTDPDFWQKWIDRWQELRGQQFSIGYLHGLVDSLTEPLREAQVREQARWTESEPRGGSYQHEIDHMKTWLKDRVEWIDNQFVAPPFFQIEGSQEEGLSLLIEAIPSAVVYYTVDGSDPRLAGGDVSPKAKVYSGPVSIEKNSVITARTFAADHRNLTGRANPPISSSWSGPTVETFQSSGPRLVISELMYSPVAPPDGSPFDKEQFEFLELKNVGVEMVDLTGIRFTRGIRFAFTDSSVTRLAPGERVVIVSNLAAFTSRYGIIPRVAGEYDGRLDNSGERLVLEGAFGETIFDFVYDGNWYPLAKGGGYSLVLADETAPMETWGDGEAWQPGQRYLGSPGEADVVLPIPTVLVNEVLAHSDLPLVDAVELYNPGTAPADIGGWFLTDDFANPKKYLIPSGTIISPGGYMVFDEYDFNVGPDGFAFSSKGEEAYIFSADAQGNLTGYTHGFSFGASENAVSFGRHVTSTGAEHFVAQERLTLEGPNSGPRLGPVVINEIMYNPLLLDGVNNVIDEYIELHNITAQPVPLFDPNAVTNSWILDDGVKFTFPSGVVLPPHGYLLVTGFDPDLEPELLAGFRSRLKVGLDVPIHGPFQGNLNNAGERIALYRPDSPQGPDQPDEGMVPFILVEEVEYLNVAPWPEEANRTGKSLQRRTGAEYANDPVNWLAASPTPGRASPGEFRITGISRIGSSTFIRFPAEAGQAYSILYQDDLMAGHWQKLMDVSPAEEFRDLEITDEAPGSDGARFYRIVTSVDEVTN